MGQKVHPFLQRVGFIRTWHSRWFAKPKDFPKFIAEDYAVRKLIKSRFKQAAISKIIMERLAERVRIRILSARPGIIIGRHGADIERLREDLNNLIKREVSIDIEEVKNPALDAQLVAENVALQLEKRIAFRRAIKRAIEQTMNSGAEGIKVSCAGRLGGAEMSRTETYKLGKIPLSTLRADIDYGFAESLTTYGLIGIKTWIYKGDILIKKIEEKQKKGNLELPEVKS
ncbi:MAG: 30S ribosomal protein S3 [Candidatus Omnitrophica bacterium]|nr:30S ribosomal protein S3 [Candidatus Omnitrophota bacterium]MDD5553299.1 30S ribosomal protein S3 [Candidatus Omnitrophota bacterium]